MLLFQVKIRTYCAYFNCYIISAKWHTGHIISSVSYWIHSSYPLLQSCVWFTWRQDGKCQSRLPNTFSTWDICNIDITYHWNNRWTFLSNQYNHCNRNWGYLCSPQCCGFQHFSWECYSSYWYPWPKNPRHSRCNQTNLPLEVEWLISGSFVIAKFH